MDKEADGEGGEGGRLVGGGRAGVGERRSQWVGGCLGRLLGGGCLS